MPRTSAIVQTVGEYTFTRTFKNTHLCEKTGRLAFVFLQTRQIPDTTGCKEDDLWGNPPEHTTVKDHQRWIWRGSCVVKGKLNGELSVFSRRRWSVPAERVRGGESARRASATVPGAIPKHWHISIMTMSDTHMPLTGEIPLFLLPYFGELHCYYFECDPNNKGWKSWVCIGFVLIVLLTFFYNLIETLVRLSND